MNSNPLYRKKLLASAIAVLSGSATVALAQDDAFNGAVLEEIVITSERREVNLQETPISATVLTGDSLIQKGVDNVDELQQVAPSLAINTYNRSTFINIRGVGIAQSAPTSNPGVAYYIDGVLIPHEQFIGQSFYDIGAIEVLRGPQGTLTGQNSTGGAIYVTTPKPHTDEFSGSIDQTLGSYGWSRTQVGANLPLATDVAALRIAGVYETRDGWVDNKGPSTGMDPGSSDLKSMRANLLLTPTDSQTYNFRYETFDYETGNIAVKDRNDPNDDPFEISYDGRGYLDQKGYRASVEGRWDFSDNLALRALYSTQDGYTKDQTDGDRTSTAPAIPTGLPASGANRALYPGRISRAQTDFETDILEVNLISEGNETVNWVAGAFFMSDDVPVILERDNYNTEDFDTSNSTIQAEAKNTSKSVFGQIDANLSEALQLTFGARYSEDEQVYTRFALPGPPPPNCFPCDTTQESDKVTGRLGLNFFASEDTMLYGTLSRGYKAGGVNLDPRQGVFEPETNDVLELGVKSELFDSRLRVNADVFYSDYADIQFASLRALFGPPLPVTENAASASAYGFEVELTGAFNALGFNVGLSYLNATFDEDVVLNDTNAGANNTVEAGDTLPFSPDITFNAGIQYDFEVGDGTLIPRLQISHIDDQLATPFDHPETRVDSRTLLDAKLTYLPTDELMIEGFVTNLRDEEYVASQIQNSSSATGGPIYGAPRQFGLRAVYNF
ncbi:TonB-dependent receptor [Aurantivibrio plasticivorans]